MKNQTIKLNNQDFQYEYLNEYLKFVKFFAIFQDKIQNNIYYEIFIPCLYINLKVIIDESIINYSLKTYLNSVKIKFQFLIFLKI